MFFEEGDGTKIQFLSEISANNLPIDGKNNRTNDMKIGYQSQSSYLDKSVRQSAFRTYEKIGKRHFPPKTIN